MYSVMLDGDTQKAIPEGDWDRCKADGKIEVWDLKRTKLNHFSFDAYYRITLVRPGREPIDVGDSIKYGGKPGWSAFGSYGFMKLEGFISLRAAEEYMLQARGLKKGY